MKMDKNIPAFGDNEMEKNKFHCHQTPTLINNIDIDTKIVSNKVPFGKQGFEYFFSYKDNEKLSHYV